MDDPRRQTDDHELVRDDGTTVTAAHLATVREQARRTADAVMSGEEDERPVLLSVVRGGDDSC